MKQPKTPVVIPNYSCKSSYALKPFSYHFPPENKFKLVYSKGKAIDIVSLSQIFNTGHDMKQERIISLA